MKAGYQEIYGGIYKVTPGSNVYKYMCSADDDIAKWQIKMDDMGAERATVEDMLTLDDDEPQTGLAVTELDGGGQTIEEEDEPLDMGGLIEEEHSDDCLGGDCHGDVNYGTEDELPCLGGPC